MIRKVYIIDDDEISVYVTSLVIEVEDFASQIQSFGTVDQAYNALMLESADSMPQIILLDLNMPVKSGWDFLEMLRPHEKDLRDKISIFVLTSSIDDTERKRSEEYNLVHGFMHKPIDQAILERIRQTYNRIRN
ncbi:response regulator [Pontibacter sp. HJ8]